MKYSSSQMLEGMSNGCSKP